MSLSRRLSQLTQSRVGSAFGRRGGGAESNRDGRVESFSDERGTDGTDLPGVVRPTKLGGVRVISHRYPVDQTYGDVALGSALDCSGSTLAALAIDETLRDVDLREALFLDTETTGLAGGTGTLPFLTGLSWFEADELVVEQYFVEDFGREAPLLAALTERMERASCIVTFNGKSFDWPLLRTRFVMNRLPLPHQPPHFDLLHSARRILKRRLKSMRLVALEETLLGTYREGDVDGAEIPEIYFNFLATGCFGQLADVLRHNELDLLAMPAFLGWLAQQYTVIGAADHPLDWIGVARLAERQGDQERACRYAHAAIADTRSPEAAAEGYIILGHNRHAAGEFSTEVEYLHQALACKVKRFYAHIHLRLAITYEHKLRRLEDALTHAAHTIPEEGYLGNKKREARLRRRLQEASTTP
jgi:uncharacterized protein